MADIQIELISPSATDTTDRLMVRRGAGPADHTIQLATPATLKGFLGLTTADVSGFNADTRAQVEAALVAGANITITPAGAGATRTLTIAASGGGATNLAYVAASRTVTSDTGTDAVLTLADGTNPGLMASADFTKLAAITGTNTGDQTSIVGITGTKAQFDTAVTDGNFLYVGDPPTAHTHILTAVTDVTMTVANLNSLDDGADSTLHFHATDRARANHTGTQAAGTITGLATIATSGSASDLGSGTLPAARFDDTAHGSRAGGALHANVVAAGAAGFMTGADKTKLDGIASGAQVNVPTDLAYTASTRLLASSTGADVTLPLVTSTDAGLAPASGGGTTNFLRADGTWNAPGGGGATNLAWNAATSTVTSDTGTDATLTLADVTNPGLAPIRSGVSTQYLSGTGVYSTPAGGGGFDFGLNAAMAGMTTY